MDLSDQMGSDDPVRVADLIKINMDECHPLGLPQSLGDGPLLHRFAVLYQLRAELVKYGYRFEPMSRAIHSLFPILELDEILARKVIPYRLTTPAAEELVRHNSDYSLPYRLFIEVCNSSVTHHEGAHALFFEIAQSLSGPSYGLQFVETMLLGEAFAMSLDQFIAVLSAADGRRSTALFLGLNSYANPFDLSWIDDSQPGSLIRLAKVAEKSPRETLTLLVCAHMVSLLRPKAVGGQPELAQSFAVHAGFDNHDPSDLEELFLIGLRVAYEFREDTLRRYFTLRQTRRELDELRAQPIASFLAEGRMMEKLLPSVLDAILGSDRETAYERQSIS